MKKNELDKDQGLRLAVQQKTETAERMTLSEDFTDRLMQRIEQQDKQISDDEHQQPKHRRVWLYSAIGAVAASIALLMMIHLGQDTTGEQPSLMAQTDTTQTVIEKVEEQPQQKETNTETADSVKMIKEKYRAPRTPRNYMAKAETIESTPEPDIIDEVELAERAFAEDKRRIEMELMAQMSGSMQADFKAMTDEIRSRGERMAQHVEMAMSTEE
jgi:hypothetical protein